MSVLAKRLHERRLNIEAEARAVISQAIRPIWLETPA